MPPTAFPAVATVAPQAVNLKDLVVDEVVPPPAKACDLTITCPTCMIEMQPEHAHYRCQQCGYRDSCCF